jgi:hypothetical protein
LSWTWGPLYNIEVPEELFAEIGCRLVLLQDLEMFIAFVAKVAFAKNSGEARDAILNADAKTLGQLLGVLRKRVTVSDSFDACLKRTLKARNLFVHEFSHEFDIRTEAGAQEGIRFLLDTMDDLEEVSNVMKAVIISFDRDNVIPEPELEEYWRNHGDLDKLEEHYVPKLSTVFGKEP